MLKKQLLLAVVCTGLFVACVGKPLDSRMHAESITPFASDAFVDSVGIVLHLGYVDTAYTQNWDKVDRTQNTHELLADLGIRHVRDSIPHSTLQPARAYTRSRFAQLYHDYGIRFISLLDRRVDDILEQNQIVPSLEEYADSNIELDGKTIPVRNLLEGIEGPNEYDKHHNQEKRESNWVQNLKNYQSILYQQVKGNSKLSQLPVIMPSLIYTQYCTDVIGSLTETIDYGNLHPYPNYPYFLIPTGNFDWHLNHGKNCFQDKPIYITETGYRTNGGGISDRTIAKYLSMLLPEFFLQPQVKRTYLYSLIDTSPERDNWGLIRPERNGQIINGFEQFTLTPKLAYNAIQSLLNLLREGNWDKSQRQWLVPAVNLRPVDIAFKGNQDSTHHLLLQKSTNDYYLLLWQQVEAFNPSNGNFEPPADEVTISLPNGYQFQTLYTYDDSFKLQSNSLPDIPNAITVQVPDSVIVLHFQPSA